jgi:NAD(P) transhydrogenase subunit beta
MIWSDGFFWLNLAACCLFILSLRYLSSPQTARVGNMVGICGMLLVLGAALSLAPLEMYPEILAVLSGGLIFGLVWSIKIKMTSLPQMIAVLNGLGGAASVLTCLAEVESKAAHLGELSVGLAVGGAAFGGSVVAFCKLSGVLRSAFGRFSYQNVLNGLLLLCVVCVWILFVYDGSFRYACVLAGAVVIFSAMLTLPIGGADMPIMISILNAFSGWAAAAIGFSLGKTVLIVTGALVGSAGTFLSFVMTRAMNRSLYKVLFDHRTVSSEKTAHTDKNVRIGTPDDAAFVLENSSKVIIVPGYGMAAAQAQYALQAMADLLRTKYGVEIKFAIHPVAGRMPGHMNVLLAEAQVPYEDFYTLEEINREFVSADAVYVIGANDITNPLAGTDPSSPIYGMPVLDVAKAKTVFFVKRSLGAGYAGVENPLFYADNTVMLYGDAKKVTEDIVRRLEEDS